MRRLSIGEMAKSHNISKKTLRLYHKNGLLSPSEVDEHSGYRYYNIFQSAQLCTIRELKSLGLSLQEIRELSECGDVSRLRDTVAAQQAFLKQEKRRVSLAEFTAASLRNNIDIFLNRPILEKFCVQHQAARRILCFEGYEDAVDWSRESAVKQFERWEKALRDVRTAMVENGIPLELFHNVGCMLPAEGIVRGDFSFCRPFLFVDDEFCEAETVFMPEGDYITFICDGMIGEDGLYREGAYLKRMLKEIDRRGLVVAGDYYGEVIGESPAFCYDGRDMMVKLQIPVRPR